MFRGEGWDASTVAEEQFSGTLDPQFARICAGEASRLSWNHRISVEETRHSVSSRCRWPARDRFARARASQRTLDRSGHSYSDQIGIAPYTKIRISFSSRS